MLKSALPEHENICIETTGASSAILENILSLGRDAGILLVRIQAFLDTCLRRIAIRDETQQIPTDQDSTEGVYRLSTSLHLPFDLVIQNEQAAGQEIVQALSEALAKSA